VIRNWGRQRIYRLRATQRSPRSTVARIRRRAAPAEDNETAAGRFVGTGAPGCGGCGGPPTCSAASCGQSEALSAYFLIYHAESFPIVCCLVFVVAAQSDSRGGTRHSI
jgi:hypothetical protein